MNYSAIDRGIGIEALGGERVWRSHVAALAPVFTVYLALAFYQIEHQSLWTDEVISLTFATSSEPISSIWFKSQCPLYYVLLRFWVKAAGTTEFALRSFSVILGVASIGLVYAIGLRLFNRGTAVIAALLLATSPFFIWYSQEVRYITLMVATALLATYALHHAVVSDRRAWWLSYTAFSILAAFSFVSIVFLFAGHGLYVLLQASRRGVLRKFVFCHLVIFALFAHWFVVQYGERLAPALARDPDLTARRASDGMLQLLDLLATIPYTFFALTAGFSLGPSVPELHISRSMASLAEHAIVLAPVAVLFGSLFIIGLMRVWQQRHSATFLLTWLFVPVLGTFLAATLTTFAVYNVRYVAMALPAYVMLLAAGIVSTRRPQLRVFLLGTVLAVNGVSLSNYYFNERYAREDARAAARYLESAARPGDIVVPVGNPTALQYYYKDLPVARLNARNAKEVVLGDVRDLAKRYDRLWLVEIRPWESDPQGKIKAALDNLAHRAGYKTFPNLEVYSYAFTSGVNGVKLERTD